jgi:hypothetical protein
MLDQNTFDVYFDLVESDIENYSSVEIHGVRDHSELPTDDTDCFVDDVNPQFYSIYVRHEDGTCLVCGDAGLSKLDDLRQVAKHFSQKHDIGYQDFTSGSVAHATEQSVESSSWTVREALEQAWAALPDASFAEQEGINRDLIVRINVSLNSVNFSDADLKRLLADARDALPKAWEKYGGCSDDLLSSIDLALQN